MSVDQKPWIHPKDSAMPGRPALHDEGRLFDLHHATGLLRCTWCQNKSLVTGGLVVIMGHSMLRQRLTNIPSLTSMTSALASRERPSLLSWTIFNKLAAYHQVPVELSDIPKTAITTPSGLFEIVRMPYGLKNAAQTFQHFMNEVTRALLFVFVYLDDIFVASKTPEEHENHLRLLLERLDERGLVLKPQNRMFGVEALDFLGHRITPQGILPLESRVQAAGNFPRLPLFASCASFSG